MDLLLCVCYSHHNCTSICCHNGSFTPDVDMFEICITIAWKGCSLCVNSWYVFFLHSHVSSYWNFLNFMVVYIINFCDDLWGDNKYLENAVPRNSSFWIHARDNTLKNSLQLIMMDCYHDVTSFEMISFSKWIFDCMHLIKILNKWFFTSLLQKITSMCPTSKCNPFTFFHCILRLLNGLLK